MRDALNVCHSLHWVSFDMVEGGERVRRNYSDLNSKFFDSSEDSSSTGSISETTSNEFWKFTKLIREPSFAAVRQHLGNPIEQDRNSLYSSLRPKTTECTTSVSSSLFSHQQADFDPKMEEKKARSCFRKYILDSLRCGKNYESLDKGQKGFLLLYAKILILVVMWVFCTVVLIEKKEKVVKMQQISIARHEIKSYWIPEQPEQDSLSITLEGAFLPSYYSNISTRFLDFWVEAYEKPNSDQLNISAIKTQINGAWEVSDVFKIPIVSEHLVDVVPDFSTNFLIPVNSENQTYFRIRLRTNLKDSFPLAISYNLTPVKIEHGIIYAAFVLVLLYILIIFEIVHRTLAGMLSAALSVAILAALDQRPTVSELASWIDFETILLLFSMMVLVAIFSETGIFDYLSVYTYQITNGRVWPLINTLCFFTFLSSSVLDNVTTALLMTPVTIRLCEVTELNPVPVLMAMSIFSNIGGALTPVGDPPNVIVASHPSVIAAGVSFSVFFLHMFIGIFLVAVIVHFMLRFMFRNNKGFGYDEPRDVQDLRQEIAMWQRTAASLSSYSKDEDAVKDSLLKRVSRLLSELRIKSNTFREIPYENYHKNLDELKARYPIRNKPLLIKSGLAISFVIVVFFLHSVPNLHLSLGCTAFMGALFLLIIADRPHLEGILARVEWSTLLFFASLFILMEALSRLRLIEWIGQCTEQLILGVNPDYQLSVAILLILWVSAGVSAFVDNIPLTTMMIRIVASLSSNPELGLPLLPLVWSLCFGACLGGVATLIGSSSNVVCAGVAEQHGYRFSFVQYSKLGIPITFVSLLVVSAYLMIAHVGLEWNTHS